MEPGQYAPAPGRYGLYLAADDWQGAPLTADHAKLQLLFDDPSFVDAEPVAVYPVQISDRVRAQRGWFTIHGNNRIPLEVQAPKDVVKLILQSECVKQAKDFLELAGLHRFAIYPDLDNLARWLSETNEAWAKSRRAGKARGALKHRRTK